jgi:serine/threonine protein kinase
MELCTGRELYERLSQLRRYTEKDAADVAMQMLEAINYCHAHAVCHRDLKLENWVYASAAVDSPLKLIDFGMSKVFNEGVPLTAIHGTVYYVAPEVLTGKYDNACDVWSIGVIVYMLLSGSPPFGGQQDYEIIQRIKTAQVVFEGPRWAGISEDAKDFVRELLTRNPKQRPSASSAMSHRWIKAMVGSFSQDSVSSEIELTVLENIRQVCLIFFFGVKIFFFISFRAKTLCEGPLLASSQCRWARLKWSTWRKNSGNSTETRWEQ